MKNKRRMVGRTFLYSGFQDSGSEKILKQEEVEAP